MLSDIIKNAKIVGEWILNSYLKEAKEEGHIMDVKVRGYAETAEESLEIDVTYIDPEKSLFIDLIGNDYLLRMTDTQSASSINWDPEDMLEYGRRIYPGLTREQTISKLRSLRNYQRVVGVPNQRSFVYSKNGRRNSFDRFGILEKQNEIEKLVDLATFVNFVVCEIFDQESGTEI